MLRREHLVHYCRPDGEPYPTSVLEVTSIRE
jgi:hypothetical protein